MPSRFETAIDALDRAIRTSTPFRSWLRGRRWCGEAIGMRSELAPKDRALLSERPTEALVLFLVTTQEGPMSQMLHLPLSVATARFEADAFELTAGTDRLYVSEAERRETYAKFLVEGIQRSATLQTLHGDRLHFRGEPVGAYRSMLPTAVGDTSNLLLQVATVQRELMVKSYKLLDARNREPTILDRLHGKGFAHVPRLLGEMALGEGEDRIVLAVATDRVDAVDLFTYLSSGWRSELAGTGAVAVPVFESASLELAAALGEATAALHADLADAHPGPFQVEIFEPKDAEATYRAATANLGDALRRLGLAAKHGGPIEGELGSRARRLLLENRRGIEETLHGITASVGGVKCVTHADLHLGQVLRRGTDGQLFFVDFEGEPERAPGQRSYKLPPLRDVATMNRSFAYVKHYAWRESTGDAHAALGLFGEETPPGPQRTWAERLLKWETAAVDRFSREYVRAATPYRDIPFEESSRAIQGWMMEKALYELRYELKHRPANMTIPLEGVLKLASSTANA